MRIGVLAAQGAFAEHIAILHQLKVEVTPVRLPAELVGLDGLIIPGGESTSISRLMLDYNLASEIRSLAKNGLPIFGTCAGMILLAKRNSALDAEPLGVMDITVRRNAFGRQRDSFETELSIPVLGEKPFPGVFIRAPVDISGLLEVVLDLGRPPEARFPQREVILNPQEVSQEDIDYVASRISSFGDDNRAGIERTLHRISAIRNRRGRIVGLTCRVGRAIFGTIKVIEDLIQSGKSALLLGRPGVGKTTMLREVARVLADDLKKRVIIVDTSNEIAGDGDIPHPAIGHARRMQVTTPTRQHMVMIEAVEIQDWDRVAIHPDVGEAVDAILRGQPIATETRWLDETGEVKIEKEAPIIATKKPTKGKQLVKVNEICKLYLFGINRGRLEQTAKTMQLSLDIVNNLSDASLFITSKNYYRRKPQKVKDAEVSGIPIYVLKSNTPPQIRQLLNNIYPTEARDKSGSFKLALGEAENAISQVKRGQEEVELSPQSAYIRRLQHLLAERNNLGSKSLGKDPDRRVRIYRE